MDTIIFINEASSDALLFLRDVEKLKETISKKESINRQRDRHLCVQSGLHWSLGGMSKHFWGSLF